MIDDDDAYIGVFKVQNEWSEQVNGRMVDSKRQRKNLRVDRPRAVYALPVHRNKRQDKKH